MENNSDGKSLDLLSAALNQSGLINCDEKSSAIKKDDIHNIITSQDSTSTAQDKLLVYINSATQHFWNHVIVTFNCLKLHEKTVA